MADLDDVLMTLASLSAAALYPNGISNASAVGAEVKIYPGWPAPNMLDTDIAAGNAHVSIFPRPEERNTTRYQTEYKDSHDTPGTAGTAVKEVRRQERLIQLVIWAPSPEVRTAIARILDPMLSQLVRFTLPDDTSARITYKGSPVTDMLQKAAIYRRDLFYTVEYATTISGTFHAITKTTVTINAT